MELELVKNFGTSDDSTNMLIFGDNHTVLKELIKDQTLKEKIKLIYIDPPFSTNGSFKIGEFRTATISSSENDEIAYEDKLVGNEYLKFLEIRLILLREILAINGSIYFHINYKIGHYVKILMDKIFKENNFINDITRIKSNPKNFDKKGFGNIKDMILFYSKNKEYVWNEQRLEYTEKDVENKFRKVDQNGRKYTAIPLHAPGETKSGKTGQKWKGISPPSGRHWRSNPEEFEKLDKAGLIEWSKNKVPRKIIYADEQIKKGMKIQDIWNFKDPQYPLYPTEKNLEMLKLIIKTSSNIGDIVLDSFCGSGTTIIASEQLERKWIGIDSSALSIKTTIQKLNKLANVKKWSLYKEKGKKLPKALEEFL